MFLRPWLGPALSKIIMPAQNVSLRKRKNKREDGLDFSYANVQSTGKAKINFCEIQQKSKQPKSIKNQKVIIFAHGNGDFYENHYEKYKQTANQYPQAKVVGFNFRNVQKSTGIAYSENDWVDDTLALVNHYRKKGVATENILLIGHSLGGAIITMAAAKLYEEQLKKSKNKQTVRSVKVINNRSFSTLTNQVICFFASGKQAGFICAGLYGAVTLFACLLFTTLAPALAISAMLGAVWVASGFLNDKIPEALVKPWVAGILWLSFGTMDALSAYKKLPNDAKDYVMANKDGLISIRPSLHQGLRSIRSKQKQSLKETIEKGGKAAKTALDKLIDLKDSKLTLPHQHDGYFEHNGELAMLQTYHKCRSEIKQQNMPKQISGEKVINNKIKRLLHL